MTASIATRGIIAPSTAGGGGGGGGPSGDWVQFVLLDVDGVEASGVNLTTAGVVKVSIDGVAYVNAAGTITDMGDGVYQYEFDETEVGAKQSHVKVVKVGYRVALANGVFEVATTDDLDSLQTNLANNLTAAIASITGAVTAVPGEVWDVLRAGHVAVGSFGEGVVVSALASGALDAIRDRFLDYSHRSGRTVRGWIRRSDAVVAGKATGLLSAFARFFAPGGVIAEIIAPQNVRAGTRDEPDVSGSEAP
jgi:hypothetical protein